MTDAVTDLDHLAVGQSASLHEVMTAERVEAFARLTGDTNPIHLSETAARAVGETRPLAHGALLLGMLSQLIGTRLPGHGSIWFDQHIEFPAPVYVGDAVEIVATITHVSPGARAVVLDVSARAGQSVVMRGRARVRVPRTLSGGARDMERRETVAVVTGGSRGLGRAVAELLGARGTRVIVGYRTDVEGAEACVAAIREGGGQADAVAADVSTADGAHRLVDRCVETFQRVDAIVHCATPRIRPTPYLETARDQFQAFFDTYVLGLHELVIRAAPGMKERRHGRIVAVSSSATGEVPPKLSAYVTAKQAQLGLCRAQAVELGPWNITVNAVSPSMIISDYSADAGLAAREIVARRTPLRRLAEADEVARVVAFLVSDDAGFVSGANVPVTGGILV